MLERCEKRESCRQARCRTQACAVAWKAQRERGRRDIQALSMWLFSKAVLVALGQNRDDGDDGR